MVSKFAVFGLALGLGLAFPTAPGADVPERLVVSFTPEAAPVDLELAGGSVRTRSENCGEVARRAADWRRDCESASRNISHPD